MDLLVYLAPEGAVNLTGLSLYKRTLGFTACVSLLCALLSRNRARLAGLRPAPVIAQTALSLLLVSGTFVLAHVDRIAADASRIFTGPALDRRSEPALGYAGSAPA